MADTSMDHFIFMKIGTHAGESLEEILQRKNLEYARAGRIFWGYGGSSCHPMNQVQPFAMKFEKNSNIISGSEVCGVPGGTAVY